MCANIPISFFVHCPFESFHVSFQVKFGYMGCFDFSINNPQNFNVMYYIFSQILYKKYWMSVSFLYISRTRFIQFADPFASEADNILYYVK